MHIKTEGTLWYTIIPNTGYVWKEDARVSWRDQRLDVCDACNDSGECVAGYICGKRMLLLSVFMHLGSAYVDIHDEKWHLRTYVAKTEQQ